MPAQSKPAKTEPKSVENETKSPAHESKDKTADSEPKSKPATPEPKSNPAALEAKPKLKLLSQFNMIIGAQLVAKKVGKIFSSWF